MPVKCKYTDSDSCLHNKNKDLWTIVDKRVLSMKAHLSTTSAIRTSSLGWSNRPWNLFPKHTSVVARRDPYPRFANDPTCQNRHVTFDYKKKRDFIIIRVIDRSQHLEEKMKDGLKSYPLKKAYGAEIYLGLLI